MPKGLFAIESKLKLGPFQAIMAEFELRVTELERKCLKNPDLDIEVMYFELFHPHYA